MPDYLLEIGTEELPADYVPEAQERLKELMGQRLSEAHVGYEGIETLGTPRRLACLVRGIAAVQETTSKKVKGPPVKSAFDAGGNPLPPAVGFAQKQGVTVEELDRETIGGSEYLVANLTIEGKPVGEVLKEIVPGVIEHMSGERLMRWGSSDLKFSRPIRWLVSLVDGEEVPVRLDGIVSGRQSYGHRILAPGQVEIRGSGTYVEDLRKACVLVDPVERKRSIEEQVERAAGAVEGQARRLRGPLLEEVVNITEWPSAVLGEFSEEYLELPDTLIETVMVHHQRYFPVEKKGGDGASRELLPYFISVANTDREDARPVVRKGNERVLKARLADGKFFFFDDQKVKLAERKQALSQLTFQEGLGSYKDKRDRLVEAARILSRGLGLEARLSVCLERTMELCKLDLVTNLVRELPELQGHVGSWYAEREGEPPFVVRAIASHYAPRSTDDAIPSDTVGCFASVLDKLDNLVSLFALGKRPSGSSDPYALRRQCHGLVDILVEGLHEYRVDVSMLAQRVLAMIEPHLTGKRRPDAARVLADVREFIEQRLKAKLMEMGFRREVVEAVAGSRCPLEDVPDAVTRCRGLEILIASDGGLDVVRAGVRVGNILTPESPDVVNPELFDSEAETALWQAFNTQVAEPWKAGGQFPAPVDADDYRRLLGLLAKLTAAVDRFFDDVMVNCPDQTKRDNRHGLLRQIDRYFKAVADFPKLQPLLP